MSENEQKNQHLELQFTKQSTLNQTQKKDISIVLDKTAANDEKTLNCWVLQQKKEEVLNVIESGIGPNARDNFDQLITLFYSQDLSFEERRNSLATILLVLFILKQPLLADSISIELCYFLKKAEQVFSGVEKLADLLLFLPAEREVCSSLFRFLSVRKFGYILPAIIEAASITLASCDKLTVSLLVLNNHLDALDKLLTFSERQNISQQIQDTKDTLFSALQKKFAEIKYQVTPSSNRECSLAHMFDLLLEGNYEHVWRGMLQHLKRESEQYSNNSQRFAIAQSTLKTALNFKRLDFIREVLLTFKNKTAKYLTEDEVFLKLLRLLRELDHFSNAVFILSCCYKHIKSIQQQKCLIQYFQEIISPTNDLSDDKPISRLKTYENAKYFNLENTQQMSDIQLNQKNINLHNPSAVMNKGFYTNHLIFTISPLATSLVIAKIFFALSAIKFTPLKDKLRYLAQQYLNLAVKFSEQSNDLRYWNIILFHPIFPAKSSILKITSKHIEFFFPFLSLPIIKNTLLTKWKSSKDYSLNLFGCSSLLNCFTLQYGPVLRDLHVIPIEEINVQDQDDSRRLLMYFTKQNASDKEERNELQKSVTEAIGNIIEKEQQTEAQQSLLQSRGVSSSDNYDEQVLSKINYFFWDGVHHVRYTDLKLLHFGFQKIILEKSAKLRAIIDLIFAAILLIFLYIFTKRFVDQYTESQSVSAQYLILNFQNIPPLGYQSTWTATCASFLNQIQSGVIRIPSIISSYSDLTDDNYKQQCQIRLITQSCGISAIQSMFQQDCQGFLYFMVIIKEITLPLTIILILIASRSIQWLSLRVLKFQINQKFPFTISEGIDYISSALAITGIVLLQVRLDYLNYLNGQDDQYDLDSRSIEFKSVLLWLCICVCIQVFFQTCTLSENLSVMLNMLRNIFLKAIPVLFLMSLLIVIFTAYFYMTFTYDSDFNTLLQSFITISAPIFKFDVTTQLLSQHQALVLLLFLAAFNLIALTLLIATFSYTFTAIKTLSAAQYAIQLNNNLNLNKGSLNTKSITHEISPINLVTSPFTLILLIFGKPDLANTISSHISYLPLGIIFFLLFASFSLIILPFSYLFTFFTIIINYKQSLTLSFFPRMFLAILWIILGFPLLVLIFILNDLPLFIRLCYASTEKKQSIFYSEPSELLDISLIQNIIDEYSGSKSDNRLPLFRDISSETFIKTAQTLNSAFKISKACHQLISKQTLQNSVKISNTSAIRTKRRSLSDSAITVNTDTYRIQVKSPNEIITKNISENTPNENTLLLPEFLDNSQASFLPFPTPSFKQCSNPNAMQELENNRKTSFGQSCSIQESATNQEINHKIITVQNFINTHKRVFLNKASHNHAQPEYDSQVQANRDIQFAALIKCTDNNLAATQENTQLLLDFNKIVTSDIYNRCSAELPDI